MLNSLFLRAFQIDQAKASFIRSYYSDIPALKGMERFEFNQPVTFFVGENGSGKSTLLEALAVTLGFNPEGGH